MITSGQAEGLFLNVRQDVETGQAHVNILTGLALRMVLLRVNMPNG
jgi:hypothetical protein